MYVCLHLCRHTYVASWRNYAWAFFAPFLGPSMHHHLTRSPRLMDRSWWNLVQNEAEVVLVLFLVTTFCEFGVKGAKTSVVVKKVVFFGSFLELWGSRFSKVGYTSSMICTGIISRYIDMIKRISNNTSKVSTHQISTQSEHFKNMQAGKYI